MVACSSALPRSRTPTPYLCATSDSPSAWSASQNLVGVGDRFVDFRGDGDRALAVLAADARESGRLVEVDDLGERHFDAPGTAQVETSQIALGERVVRQADTDRNLFVTPCEAPRDHALEGGAHLARGALCGEAERTAARIDSKDRLLLAVGGVVLDVAHTGETAEQLAHLACRRLERLYIVARDPNVDLAAGWPGCALEDCHGLQTRHGAHPLAPFLDQRLRAYGALIGGLQLDPHGTHVVAGTEEEIVGTDCRLADLAEAHDHEATGAACQRELGLVQRPPELVHHGGCRFPLGALDKGDVGEHGICFRRREEDEGDASARDQPYEEQKEADRDGNGQVSARRRSPARCGRRARRGKPRSAG